MKVFRPYLLAFALLSGADLSGFAGEASVKPRIIATTDGEIDDRCSMVRFLLYANEWDIKGIIHPQWPDIQVLLSDWPSFEAIAYPWKKCQPKELHPYFDKAWMTSSIVEGHGPLCAMYETKKGRFRSEGDTPSFFHVISTGLRSHEHPTYGGWGGRFVATDGIWKTQDVRGVLPHSILRWAKDFQNDWAARADWCVKDYDQSNHPPQVVLSHKNKIAAKPGERLKLDASASTDPDGDTLMFNWWVYAEAGSYGISVDIENNKASIARLSVPADASPGNTIHAICSVTDAGGPILTRYGRVIIEVSE